jgi:hypothetical protein
MFKHPLADIAGSRPSLCRLPFSSPNSNLRITNHGETEVWDKCSFFGTLEQMLLNYRSPSKHIVT